MRIVLIGDFEGRSDEGMRKQCHLIRDGLQISETILTVETHQFCSFRSLPALRKFQPGCLHYLTGPTAFSLIALKAHKFLLGKKVVTVSAGLRPFLGGVARGSLKFFKPDYFLAQARLWKNCFETAGSRIIDFPNGINCKQFHPVSFEEKRRLRNKLELPEGKPIVLHIGHVKSNRNLECLIETQQSGRYQVVIVGSQSFSEVGNLRESLAAAGCIIRTEYCPAIHEYYQASDLYVFTVRALPEGRFPRSYNEVGVIDFPLSVLEAMACGLRVVSTSHDALKYFLKEEPGISYFDGSGKDCLQKLNALKNDLPNAGRICERFNLQKLFSRLDQVYSTVRNH